MSFQPIIQVLQVPRTSSSFFFKDNTPVYPGNTTGWGAPNGPASTTDITSVWGAVQGYGRVPLKSTNVAGNLATKAEIIIPVPDGVNTFYIYYGQVITANWSLSADRMFMTFSDVDAADQLDNVSGLSENGEFPILIKSKVGGVVELYESFPGSAISGTSIYRYWFGKERHLVLNCVEGRIVNAIGSLPIDQKKCETSQPILDLILLKIAAGTAYDCGNFSRAQEAAELGCNSKPSVNSNCINCG